MTEINNRPEYDDEIDLIELISKLWKEKTTIVISTIVVTLIGVVYAITTKPVYQATVQIELPTTAELAPLNNTQLITTTPTDAFTQILTILESDAHKKALATRQKPLLAQLFNTEEENISSASLYAINYPNTNKRENSLQPDIYTLTTEGTNRELIKTLLDNNIELATKQLLEKWQQEFSDIKAAKIEKTKMDFDLLTQAMKERRENTITRLTEEVQLATKKIKDELAARKAYVVNNRKDQIIKLEEALKIAQTLNITQPSTLSQMAIQSSEIQVGVNTEIRNQQDPLYLRGKNLLSAELESLKKLPQDTFLDSKILELEAELLKLKKNREIDILKVRESDIAFNETLQNLREKLRKISETQFPKLNLEFQNTTASASKKPIKPKKTLILAISILLGGMLGLFIAIGRIVYKNYMVKASAA